MRYRVDAYVEAVLSGRQPVNELVRAVVERHVRDLEEGHERGLFFDRTAVVKVLLFFEQFLRHSKGEWAGRTFALEPWQQFVLAMIFGWKRADGTRRFRTAYIEIPRKNGKSALSAGIGLFLMAADGEPGAEVYSVATKRDQAALVHTDARRMVEQSPELRRFVKRFRNNLHVEETYSKFEPLSADHDSLDGLNVHGAICDELHAWRHREMWDVIETATGSRRQPLMVAITTAGFDRRSLCWQLHDYSEKLARQVVKDDSFLGIVFSIDEGDDWEEEATWFKANPNLGVSKKIDDMRRLATRAKAMPAQLNAFLRLHLNVWTQAESRWVDRREWDACGERALPSLDDLKGRRCYGGLDLASTSDVSALVWVFPGEGKQEPWWVLPRFWIPDEAIYKRSKRDRVPYEAWLRDGLIFATSGNRTDYDFIEAQILEDVGNFEVAEIAFDPWNATAVSNHLLDQGVAMVEFRQGFVSMNPAMKAFDVGLGDRRIGHAGNLVLTWMADNLVVKMDPAGSIKPDKDRSTEKIDGMVALVMAYYRATLGQGSRPSVYEDRGIRFL